MVEVRCSVEGIVLTVLSCTTGTGFLYLGVEFVVKYVFVVDVVLVGLTGFIFAVDEEMVDNDCVVTVVTVALGNGTFLFVVVIEASTICTVNITKINKYQY